jgi:hypothetical protein
MGRFLFFLTTRYARDAEVTEFYSFLFNREIPVKSPEKRGLLRSISQDK